MVLRAGRREVTNRFIQNRSRAPVSGVVKSEPEAKRVQRSTYFPLARREISDLTLTLAASAQRVSISPKLEPGLMDTFEKFLDA